MNYSLGLPTTYITQPIPPNIYPPSIPAGDFSKLSLWFPCGYQSHFPNSLQIFIHSILNVQISTYHLFWVDHNLPINLGSRVSLLLNKAENESLFETKITVICNVIDMHVITSIPSPYFIDWNYPLKSCSHSKREDLAALCIPTAQSCEVILESLESFILHKWMKTDVKV